MRHSEAIRTLLHVLDAPRAAAGPTDAARTQAEQHVASCSDCWQTFGTAYEAATGARLPDGERGQGLFRCADVQQRLDRLVTLSPSSRSRLYPDDARHLGWCHPCRSRFAALVELTEATADRTPTAARTHAFPRLADILVEIRDGFAELLELASGFSPVPVPAGGPVRGAGDAGHDRIRLSFARAGVAGTIHVDAGPDRTVRLTMHFDDPTRRSIRLRDRATGTRVASEYSGPTGDAVIRGIPTGRYVVEIVEGNRTASFDLDLVHPMPPE